MNMIRTRTPEVTVRNEEPSLTGGFAIPQGGYGKLRVRLPMVGTNISHYEIVEKLGEVRMGRCL